MEETLFTTVWNWKVGFFPPLFFFLENIISWDALIFLFVCFKRWLRGLEFSLMFPFVYCIQDNKCTWKTNWKRKGIDLYGITSYLNIYRKQRLYSYFDSLKCANSNLYILILIHSSEASSSTTTGWTCTLTEKTLQ